MLIEFIPISDDRLNSIVEDLCVQHGGRSVCVRSYQDGWAATVHVADAGNPQYRIGRTGAVTKVLADNSRHDWEGEDL